MPNQTLTDMVTIPPPRYPGVSDEEAIRRLMRGRPLLPVEYRQEMSPAEQQALYSQGSQGMTPAVGPMSLLDLVMEPVGALLDEADLTKYLLPLALLGTVKNPAGRMVPGTTRKSGTKKVYDPAPESIRREAEKMMSLRDMTESQAMRQAERKLRWQEYERPRIETQYETELRPANFNATKRRLLQKTPAAVQRKVEEVRNFLKQPTEPWEPKDYGIFDRGRIPEAMEGFPGVEQTMPVRPSPGPRTDISYVHEVYDDPVNRELIKGQVGRGMKLGGETFYPSYYPIKYEWMSRGGDPAKFDEWAEQVATASARNSLNAEMSVGNLLRGMYYAGIPLTKENVTREMRRFKKEFGVKLPLMPVHTAGSARRLEQGITMKELIDRKLTDAFKIPTYGMQRRGDFRHTWTGDVHEAGGETFGSRFNPYFWEQGGFGKYEYGPAESHMGNITREMGLPAVGTAQAGRWFGGGELTDLVSARGDALDQIEKQAAYTLHQAGRPTDPVTVRNFVMDLIEKGGDVAPWTRKNVVMPDYRIARPASGGIYRPQTPPAPRNRP